MRLISCLFVMFFLLILACAEERPLQPVEPFSLGLHERWENVEAEEMAAWVSGELTAPRMLYERIEADLTEIRENWGDTFPSVLSTRFLAPVVMSWVGVIVDFDARNDIIAGAHADFDSLNALYGATEWYFSAGANHHLTVKFETVLNPCGLYESYARLRGVRSVHGNGVVDCRCRYIYPLRIGDTMHYYFESGFGMSTPCFCSGSFFHYFRTTSTEIEFVGSHSVWLNREDSIPAWRGLLSEAIESHHRCKDDTYRFVDKTPPARITNLTLIGHQEGDSARIWYTTPGDDGMEGNALEVMVLAAHEPISDGNWDRVIYKSAKFPTGHPGRDTMLTIVVDPHRTNYIAIRSHDGSGNWSTVSNNVISRNAWLAGWTYFTTSNSPLPSNTVNAMFQDSDGRIWTGTNSGVAVLDGGNWTVFNTSNSGLPDNRVAAIAEGENGAIWAGTFNGLARYDGVLWESYTEENSQIPKPNIACMATGIDGGVWTGYGYEGYGLHQFDGFTWTRHDPWPTPQQGFTILSIITTRDGSTWFGAVEGLHRLDAGEWSFFNSQDIGLPVSYITALLHGTKNDIWAGSNGGLLLRYDGTEWRSWQPQKPGRITGLAQTSNGNLWIAIGGGLWRHSGNSWRNIRFNNSGLPSNSCVALLVEHPNTLWIGTSASGLCRWDLKAAKLSSVSDLAGLDVRE